VLLSQHTATGRVGRRVAPEGAAAALSDRNDGLQLFSAANSHPRQSAPSAEKVLLSVHQRLENPIRKIRVHLRPSAVKKRFRGFGY
jgi:hypothetical protein